MTSSRLREVLAVEGMKTRRWLGSGSSVAEMKMLDEDGVDGDWLGSFASLRGAVKSREKCERAVLQRISTGKLIGLRALN